MDAIQQITELIEPTVRDLGFEVVRVLMTGGQRPTVQVMVEPVSREPMTVDDCARLSHAISALLDVADPIAGTYRLEVTSPGIDRPLVRRADFERFAGFEARLETVTPIDGRDGFAAAWWAWSTTTSACGCRRASGASLTARSRRPSWC